MATIEELLRAAGARAAALAATIDDQELLRRIEQRLCDPRAGRIDPEPRGSGAADCALVDEPASDVLAAVRHLTHGRDRAGCVRRAAELLDRGGLERSAVACWRRAAAMGDRDAQDYVTEFVGDRP